MKTDPKKPDKTDLPFWADVTSTCDTLLTHTALFKDGTHKRGWV